MATNIKFKLSMVCDWTGKRRGCKGLRGCAATVEVFGDPETETLEQFTDRAMKELTLNGWNARFGPDLCCEHNTATNRKKTFIAPEPGSMAALIREARS